MTSPHKEANMRRNDPLSLNLPRGWPPCCQVPGCLPAQPSDQRKSAVALPDLTESLLAESGHIACRLPVVDLRE